MMPDIIQHDVVDIVVVFVVVVVVVVVINSGDTNVSRLFSIS